MAIKTKYSSCHKNNQYIKGYFFISNNVLYFSFIKPVLVTINGVDTFSRMGDLSDNLMLDKYNPHYCDIYKELITFMPKNRIKEVNVNLYGKNISSI